MSSIRYRPEIDGLRALAILPVLLFHLGVGWIRGGFLGVDVFFVISGYLITSIILKDYDRGAFTFIGFWLRRIRRIMPVLLAMVAATLMAGRLMVYSPDIASLGNQGLAALLSLSNINFWFHSGSYWGEHAQNLALLHTWSLSVEEQFYLFFPLSLFVLLKFCNKRLIPVSLFLSAASLLLYLYGALRHPSAAFYLLPTRAWELGSGCVLAMLNHRHPTMLRNNSHLSRIGLLAVAVAYVLAQAEGAAAPFVVLSAAGASLILAFARDQQNAVNRLLSTPPLVYLGKLSYSLYIWHWPVLVLSRQLPASGHAVPSLLVSVLLIFALAMVSYHVIERYTRQNPKALPFLIAAFLASLAYSWHLATADLREDISFYSETTWDGQRFNVSPRPEFVGATLKRMDGIAIPGPDVICRDAYAKGGIQSLYGKATPDIVLLGDSHALMWAGVLDEIAQELGQSISFYAADGTPPFFDIPVRKKKDAFFNAEEKYAYDVGRLGCLQDWKPRVVIIAARWSGYEDMQEAVDLLQLLTQLGSEILLVEQPPELFFGNKNAPRYLSFMGLKPNGDRRYISALDSKEYRRGRELIQQMATTYPHCTVVPVADLFLNGSNVWVLDGPDVLYVNGDHLSHQGALRGKPAFLRKIQDCFANPALRLAGDSPQATAR